jgi:hypothetical protein
METGHRCALRAKEIVNGIQEDFFMGDDLELWRKKHYVLCLTLQDPTFIPSNHSLAGCGLPFHMIDLPRSMIQALHLCWQSTEVNKCSPDIQFHLQFRRPCLQSPIWVQNKRSHSTLSVGHQTQEPQGVKEISFSGPSIPSVKMLWAEFCKNCWLHYLYLPFHDYWQRHC